MNNAIEVTSLKKGYHDASGSKCPVLKDLSLTVAEGEVVAIVGSSGSGKSTLLHCIGGLDDFDEGSVIIAGTSLSGLSEKARGTLRNQKMGFVYQFHHLLPEFTALENVAMPLLIARKDETAQKTAREVLASVGLSERLFHYPSQLSGGERQRTAIARALVTHPACILADEPTGNLDSDTASEIFGLFTHLAHQEKTAVVIVTHDLSLAARCDRILSLVGGTLTQES